VIAGRVSTLASPACRFVALGIATGVGAAMVWRFGWSPLLPAYLALAALSGIVVVTDATEHRIPTKVVLPAYPIGVALLALACAIDGSWLSLARAAFAGGAVALCYLALALAFPGSVGLGDVRLGGLLGGYLGFLGWMIVTSGVLFGWLLGACFVLICYRVPRRQIRLPLGPFLLAGAFVAIVASR